MDFNNMLMFFVGVIFIFAIFDLMVWVSNDAINFLSPAVWSKAWNYKSIIIITAFWLLIWTIFSSWLMEVARKWIFYPQYFNLVEITILFLSVMVADILLLNKFNSLGLPTSTTVSIVFCLLGSAVAMWTVKIIKSVELTMADLVTYINTDKVLFIILWIFWSVLVSFVLWWIVQYITRMIFTFNYEEKPNYWKAILWAIATTAITQFIFVKWLKWSVIANYEWIISFMNSNFMMFLFIIFIFWFIIFQLLLIFRANVFKIVVLIWTFSLALAFAWNDLVNFIWVPLAALKSYSLFSTDLSITDPNLFFMDALNKKEKANIFMLLTAGLIMVATLIFSKKSKNVLNTWLDLSRQDWWKERFGSSYPSKVIVRKFLLILRAIEKIVPEGMWNYIWDRFKKVKNWKKENTFDLIRASVILICSSILISLATSYKLPLSTTYVTFMVAMWAAFADRSWWRESAVYRVNWVISVISWWFLTAFWAFLFAFVLASIIYFWGSIAAIIIILFTVYVMLKPLFAKEEHEDEDDLMYKMNNFSISSGWFLKIIKDNLSLWKQYFHEIINCLWKENIWKMKKITNNILEFKMNIYDFKKSLLIQLWDIDDKEIKLLSTYIWIINSMKNYSKSLLLASEITTQYIDNNHIFSTLEFENLKNIILKTDKIYEKMFETLEKRNFSENFDELESFLLKFDDYIEEDLELVKKEKVDIQSSIFYINVLNELKFWLLEIKAIHKRAKRLVGK